MLWTVLKSPLINNINDYILVIRPWLGYFSIFNIKAYNFDCFRDNRNRFNLKKIAKLEAANKKLQVFFKILQKLLQEHRYFSISNFRFV